MAEGRVIDLNVLGGDLLRLEKRLEDLVGGAGIDVVGAFQHPALRRATFATHQIFDRWNRLLVWRRAGIEDVFRAFLALVLHRVKQQAVQLFEDREHGFPRHRGPATEHCGDLFLGQQITCLLGEQRPVRGRVDDDRFNLLAEQPTLFIDVVRHHQDGVFECGLADRHRSRQRMQHADLDRPLGLGGGSAACARDHRRGQRRMPNPVQHLVSPLVICLGAVRSPGIDSSSNIEAKPDGGLRMARSLPRRSEFA